MRHLAVILPLIFALSLLFVACDSGLTAEAPPEAELSGAEADRSAALTDAPYAIESGVVFDVAATPKGSLLSPAAAFGDLGFQSHVIKEITRHGVFEVGSVPVEVGSINSIETVGTGNFLATFGNNDLAGNAGLWRISRGNTRLVADIEAFTLGDWNPDVGFEENDPQAAGPHPEWKDFRCEALAGFSHGPQSNPYHLTALSGSEVLIADAANNGVLWAKTNGSIEAVAFMNPAVRPGDDPDNPDDWMILGFVDEDGVPFGPGKETIPCYVEPVPTSVAIGPDGAYYVSELTGATPENFELKPSPEGLARVWRIEPGARDVVCPSDQCTLAISDLTAVIDIEFGPDGRLYVVEFDHHGGMVAFIPDIGRGFGAIRSCDITSGGAINGEDCIPVEEDLNFPGAISFDKSNNLWLVENMMGFFDTPTVRKVEWQQESGIAGHSPGRGVPGGGR